MPFSYVIHFVHNNYTLKADCISLNSLTAMADAVEESIVVMYAYACGHYYPQFVRITATKECNLLGKQWFEVTGDAVNVDELHKVKLTSFSWPDEVSEVRSFSVKLK